MGKVGLKAKAGAKGKAKGGLKLKAKPKVAVKGKVGLKLKAKPKVAVKAKVGVKHRRLQAPKDGFQPPLKPATPVKKDDKKPATPAKKDDKVATPVTTNKDGLPVSEYSKDVAVPADLEGSSDQTAPKSSNLIKFAFMLFAAFMTMF